MFKHHKLDALLILITCLQVILLVLPFAVDFSLGSLLALMILNIFLIGTNYQCVAHNFIHNPFFKKPILNNAFSVLNSLVIGAPESLYRAHHLDHHRHNNNPEKDESSTHRFGKNGKEENIFLYSVIGTLRTPLGSLYLKTRRQSPLVNLEILVMVVFLITLSVLNWKLTLGYVLPSYLLGQFFALWENYCEHHFADFSDRKRDSVSCYNSIYNLIWFNNGYHQEHHFFPQVHWTKIQEVTEFLPEDRMIVKFCHLTNSFNSYKRSERK